jgi:hypothetical protein
MVLVVAHPDDETFGCGSTLAHASSRGVGAAPYEVMPDDLRRRFLAVDRLRRVHPPWTGGTRESELFAPS